MMPTFVGGKLPQNCTTLIDASQIFKDNIESMNRPYSDHRSTLNTKRQLIDYKKVKLQSLSHLRTMLPESSSRPLPAQQPNHATQSLFDSKSLCQHKCYWLTYAKHATQFLFDSKSRFTDHTKPKLHQIPKYILLFQCFRIQTIKGISQFWMVNEFPG